MQVKLGAAEGVFSALVKILRYSFARLDAGLAEQALRAVAVLCRHGADGCTSNRKNIDGLSKAGVISGTPEF